MRFVTTPEFDAAYEAVPESDWVGLDEKLEQLIDDPAAAWARGGRLNEGAWICRFRTREAEYRIYWDYQEADVLVLLLLLRI